MLIVKNGINQLYLFSFWASLHVEHQKEILIEHKVFNRLFKQIGSHEII